MAKWLAGFCRGAWRSYVHFHASLPCSPPPPRTQGCLAVTRAFGDRSLQPYVIADPYISCRPVNLEQVWGERMPDFTRGCRDAGQKATPWHSRPPSLPSTDPPPPPLHCRTHSCTLSLMASPI